MQLRNALHDCYRRNTNNTHNKATTYTPFPDKLSQNKDQAEAIKVDSDNEDHSKNVNKDDDDNNKSSKLTSKKVATISKVPSVLTLSNS